MEGLALEMKTTLTPETDAAEYEQDFTKAMMVESDFARKLERERDEARVAITDLTQRLQERQESLQAQLIRIEDTWREKLSAVTKELREALEDQKHLESQLDTFTNV